MLATVIFIIVSFERSFSLHLFSTYFQVVRSILCDPIKCILATFLRVSQEIASQDVLQKG